MILKITDGSTSHFVECAGEVNVRFNPHFVESEEFDGEEPWTWLAEHGPTVRAVVELRPSTPANVAALPRVIYTDLDVYLMNDAGKTIETIHRMASRESNGASQRG